LHQLFGAKAPVFVPFFGLKFWAEARPDELRSDWPGLKTGSLPGAKAPGYSALRLSYDLEFIIQYLLLYGRSIDPS